jgi:hypothetical protein
MVTAAEETCETNVEIFKLTYTGTNYCVII